MQEVYAPSIVGHLIVLLSASELSSKESIVDDASKEKHVK